MQSHLPSWCFKYMIIFVRGFKTNQQIKQVSWGTAQVLQSRSSASAHLPTHFFLAYMLSNSGLTYVSPAYFAPYTPQWLQLAPSFLLSNTSIQPSTISPRAGTREHLPIPQWILSLMEGRVYTRHRAKSTASPIAADQFMQGCLKPRSDLSS